MNRGWDREKPSPVRSSLVLTERGERRIQYWQQDLTKQKLIGELMPEMENTMLNLRPGYNDAN